MGTKRVNFRLPEELVEKADLAAEVTHRDRTDIVTAALREYLDDVADDDSFREAVVDLYLDGELGFEELAAVVGRQDAESVRASKSLLDDAEEIADDIAEL